MHIRPSTLLLLSATILSASASITGPVGGAAECCCGDQLATGQCCTITKLSDDPAVCVVDNDGNPNCQFLALYSGGSGSCPTGGYSCDSSIVCPPAPEGPTPTPAPTIQLPFDLDSCSFLTDFGTVNSQETCQGACEKYGIYCSVQGNITVCGSNFMSYENCRGDPRVECQCGSSFASVFVRKNVCEDKTELPPLRCDEALGVTSETTCKETCESFDVYCGVNSKGETECTSRYEMSDEPDEYWTCYCGPEDQVLCGDSCTTSGAHGKRMSIVLGMMVSGVATGVALLL